MGTKSGTPWVLGYSFVLAMLTQSIGFWLVGFDYNLISDDFDLVKLTVDFGSLALLLYLYAAMFGAFRKK
jgi:hypothetical protein